MKRLGTSLELVLAAYRFVLRLMPRDFRREYADELLLVVRDLLRDARREGGVRRAIGVGAWSLADVTVVVVREHVRAVVAGFRHRRLVGQLTPRAKRALQLAQQDALAVDGACRGAHILLGLAAEGSNIAAEVLRDAGIGADFLRQRLVGSPAFEAGSVDVVPSTLALARSEAVGLGHDYIGGEHLLLAALEGDSAVAAALEGRGVSAAALRQAVLTRVRPCAPCRVSRFRPVCKAAIFTGVVVAIAVAARAFAQAGKAGEQTASAQSASANVKETDVEVLLPAGGALTARLFAPSSQDPVAALVFIPGYIPSARNASEEEFRGGEEPDSGTLMARFLASQGIAVLRAPIGGGASGGEAGLAVSDLAERTLQCVAYLKGRPEIDPRRVGLIGQSIGGYVAARAAAQSKDIAFVATLATPAGSIDRAFVGALDKLLQSGGAPEDARAAVRKELEGTVAATAAGATVEELRPRVERFLRAEYQWLGESHRRMLGGTADEFVARMLDRHVNDLASPMFRSLVGYDAVATLGQLKCPTLVLFAGRDMKVESQASSAAARAALEKSGRADWTVTVIPDADHFFEIESPATRTQPLSPAFKAALLGWLREHTAR